MHCGQISEATPRAWYEENQSLIAVLLGLVVYHYADQQQSHPRQRIHRAFRYIFLRTGYSFAVFIRGRVAIGKFIFWSE